MGGEPRAAFLSLAVAGDVQQKWVDRFLKGLLELAGEFNLPLAGGDTAQAADGIQADIVVVGSVPKGKAVLRSGAKPGDQIYVTGELGGCGGGAGSGLVARHARACEPRRLAIPDTFVRSRVLPLASVCDDAA